jgi:predicted permease
MKQLDNIVLAFGVVFPLMLMMSIGYVLRRIKLTDASSLNVMNKLVFRVFLPILLFLNIYSLKPREAVNSKNILLLAIAVSCVIGTILLLHLIFWRIVKDRKKSSVMIQGIFRSNLVLFGIPIAASIYGEEHIGIVSLLAAVIVPLYNILAVILLETYRGSKVRFKTLAIGILKNPLIVASALAFIFLLIRLPIPGLILSPLDSLGKVATPLAFVVLGGTFRFDKLAGNMKYLITAVLGRLVIYPAVVFGIAILSGFRGEALVALVGLAASPTAVSSFTMAVEMDADGELAGQIVVLTSVICILTIFIWVLMLKTFLLI